VHACVRQNDTIPNVVSVEWAADGKTLFYTVPDHLKRPHKVLPVFPRWHSFPFGDTDASSIPSEGRDSELDHARSPFKFT
jgi:hypothetical protein